MTEQARFKSAPLKLHVYASPVDGKTVMAHATYGAIFDDNDVRYPLIIKFGTPVDDAYRTATAFAERNGIELKVEDPNDLYPIARRQH